MFFLHRIFVESLEFQWSVPAIEMSLVSIFRVMWREVMHTHEAPDFWGLHKNMNCAFPLDVTNEKNWRSQNFWV